MTSRVNGAVRGLGAHYLAVCLLLALFMLTLMGAGSVIRVGLLGLLLCAVGVQQSSIRVDLWEHRMPVKRGADLPHFH